jgi:hypothetical protein
LNGRSALRSIGRRRTNVRHQWVVSISCAGPKCAGLNGVDATSIIVSEDVTARILVVTTYQGEAIANTEDGRQWLSL